MGDRLQGGSAQFGFLELCGPSHHKSRSAPAGADLSFQVCDSGNGWRKRVATTNRQFDSSGAVGVWSLTY